MGVIATTIHLEVQVTRLRDSKALARIAHDIAQEALSGKRSGTRTSFEEAEARLLVEKSKRQEEGRL
jgi:hypothetical protein